MKKYKPLIPLPDNVFAVEKCDTYDFLKGIINLWASHKGISVKLDKGFFFFQSPSEAKVFKKILKKCGINIKNSSLYNEKKSNFEKNRNTKSPYPFNKPRVKKSDI